MQEVKSGSVRLLEAVKEVSEWARKPRTVRAAVLVTSVLLLIVQTVTVAIRWRWYQYDFRAYYIGPKLAALGEDPYSADALIRMSASLGLDPNNNPYLYPPHMLAVFAPLSWLPYPVAYGLWMALQATALLTIVFVATKRLDVDRVWLLGLLALGLNGAAAACLRSGQLTLVLTALTLLAAAALRRDRAGGPTVLLTLAALPKIWIAPMLGLLLYKPTVQRFLLMAAGIGVLLGVLLLDYVLAPGYSESFIASARRLSKLGESPIGPIDGSLHNFMRTVGHAFGVNKTIVLVCWGVSVLAIALATLSSCRRLIGSGLDRVPYVAFLASLGLALILPRFLVYQWTFVIPALAFVIPKIKSRVLQATLVVISLTPSLYINRYLFGLDLPHPVDNVYAIPWAFSNLIVVFVVWLVARRLG
jgi:hypothetical protein